MIPTFLLNSLTDIPPIRALLSWCHLLGSGSPSSSIFHAPADHSYTPLTTLLPLSRIYRFANAHHIRSKLLCPAFKALRPRPTLSTSPYFPKAPNMTWSRETAQVSILYSCHNRPTFVLFLCFLSYLETSFSFILTCKPSSNIHHPLSRSRLPQLHPNRSSYT